LVLALVIVTVVVVVGGWTFWQYGWPLLEARSTPAPTDTAVPTEEVAQVVTPPSPTATKTSVPFTRTVSPTDPPATEPTPKPTDPATLTPTATAKPPTAVATRTPTPTRTPTTAGATAETVELKVKAIERTWLQVTIDGEEQPGELLQTGDEREWTADFSIYLICGNAGGIEVTVNGDEEGTLGERAEVVEVTWTPEGRVTPTPQTEVTPEETTVTLTPAQEGTGTPTPSTTVAATP